MSTPLTPSATTPPAAAPKPGFMSSEFVVTLVGMLSLMIPGIPDKYMPLVIAAGGVYVAARTALKAVHTLGYASSIPDLPALPPLPAGSTTITTVPKA